MMTFFSINFLTESYLTFLFFPYLFDFILKWELTGLCAGKTLLFCFLFYILAVFIWNQIPVSSTWRTFIWLWHRSYIISENIIRGTFAYNLIRWNWIANVHEIKSKKQDIYINSYGRQDWPTRQNMYIYIHSSDVS